jgi:hypothetical protein
MLNLTAGQTNNAIIYADTISNDMVSYGDYFLLGFQDTYSKNWAYVIPTVATRNSRYVKLVFDVASANIEDPENGIVWLFAPGNWTYKVWNTLTPTLDPSIGDLIDQGQMYLNHYTPSEIVFTSYTGGNENLSNIIYYSGAPACTIDSYNSPYVIDGQEESTCNPLFVDTNGLLYIPNNTQLYIKQS